jgi:hypothetical protein
LAEMREYVGVVRALWAGRDATNGVRWRSEFGFVDFAPRQGIPIYLIAWETHPLVGSLTKHYDIALRIHVRNRGVPGDGERSRQHRARYFGGQYLFVPRGGKGFFRAQQRNRAVAVAARRTNRAGYGIYGLLLLVGFTIGHGVLLSNLNFGRVN